MANKILINDQFVEVVCDRNDVDTIEKLSCVYPWHSNRIKTSHKTSIHNLPEVLKAFRGVTVDNIDKAPPAVQDHFNRVMRMRTEVEDLITNGPRHSCAVNKHLTLMRHQQLGREIAAVRDKYGFFYDTRTGKTPMSLAVILDDIRKNPKNKWLVICPLILIENAWLCDAASFVPELKTVNCHASTKAKRLQAINSDANIYITNTESFVSYMEYFVAKGFAGVFVDESSDMKSPSSKTSKALVDFANLVPRFYPLSGTPAPNDESEYYMQMRSVDYYGWPSSFAQYKAKWLVNISTSDMYEKLRLRPDMATEFHAALRRSSLYVDKEDVLDTPGREFVEHIMELPADLKKHYNQMKNDLVVEIGNDVRITAPSIASKLNKLNQITSGFVIDTQAMKENKFYDENQQEWYLLNRYRFDELRKLLDSFGDEQVIIWANYRKEFELIKDMLGDSCRLVYGGTNLEAKNAGIRDFKSGTARYLVANPASADKGLTLTNAHICVYFSLNYSYELFKQSMERIYGDKSKQPKPCKYYIMMAKGTVDKIIYSDVLQGKGQASSAILNHLKGGLT